QLRLPYSEGHADGRSGTSVRHAHRSQADPHDRGSHEEPAQPERRPEGAAAGARREPPARALVARERLEEVVRGVDRLRLVRVLPAPSVAPEHEVAEPRGELLAPEELLGAPRDRQLADRV